MRIGRRFERKDRGEGSLIADPRQLELMLLAEGREKK